MIFTTLPSSASQLHRPERDLECDCVGLQPFATYCVQHCRGYDLLSMGVCLSAIFCQAQTMRQSNSVTRAVNNKQTILGRIA